MRWGKEDLDQYYRKRYLNLSRYDISCFVGSYNNSNVCCWRELIDELYQYIADAMSCAADVGIPTTTGQFYNHWWDDTLKDFKNNSIDAHGRVVEHPL